MEIQNLQDASGKSIPTKKSYVSKNSIKTGKNNNITPTKNSSKTSTAKTVPKLKLSK